MKPQHPLLQTLKQAITQGILPANAAHTQPNDRPWPVVLLMASGAWCVAIPVLIGIVMAFLTILQSIGFYALFSGREYYMGYILGGPTLLVSLRMLRSKQPNLFMEQLGLPLMVTGFACLGFALTGHLSFRWAIALLAVLACACAPLVVQTWARLLLGFAAANLAAIALQLSSMSDLRTNLLLLLPWLGLLGWQRQS